MINEGIPATKEAYMTKSWVSDAYYRIARLGIQVHGGVGLTKDHDMQIYFRRAKAMEMFWGDSDLYRERVAQELGL